ncbi:MAG TPA: hypothetical protein P5121_16575 [Caldilineaceae bacterium]|nr:hypothetical protein [Caldilineaceae bacterium]
MLDRLRDQAFQALAATSHCTLSTSGPAGLCASNVDLAVVSGHLYVLIPNTSDHLFNLEQESVVALTAERWELSGHAMQIATGESPFTPQQTAWSVVFQIIPQRMHLPPDDEDHTHRTIDFG